MRRFYALAMRKKDPIKVYQFINYSTPSIVFQHSMGKLEAFTRPFNYAGVTKSRFELVCSHPKNSHAD